MATIRMVSLASLGLCEHCGILLTIEDMPMGSMDAIWKCPKCSGVLTGKSFGYEENRKTRWVGNDGKWTTVRPTQSFDLGDWHVVHAAIASGN